jgi:hypothetical protein
MNVSEFIEHHGIKGMKWGVRRSKAQIERAPGSEDHNRKVEIQTKAKTQGRHTLSNREIQDVINRMNLEQQYARMNASRAQKGAKFVSNMLLDIGKTKARKAVADQFDREKGPGNFEPAKWVNG